jgi:dihydrofolate synthase/folylpolyglutamate synthase
LDAVRDILPITISNIRQGLLKVALPGRFQVLPRKPIIVLDVAHNPNAVHALSTSLSGMGFHQTTYAVFAILKDKDIDGVVRALIPKVDVWLIADINSPRGASTDEVVQALENAGVSKASGAILVFSNPVAAYVFACEQSTKNDRICVFGSFYVVGEVMEYLNLVKYE